MKLALYECNKIKNNCSLNVKQNLSYADYARAYNMIIRKITFGLHTYNNSRELSKK